MEDQVTPRKDDITTMQEITLTQSKGELITPEPSLADLAATIKKGHSEVERNALNVVGCAILTGKALLIAKKRVRHGYFADYVAIKCGIAMRTAQNYMKLARNEAKIIQNLGEKAHGDAYLTMGEAFKWINKLGDKGKRRKKAKPKQAEP